MSGPKKAQAPDAAVAARRLEALRLRQRGRSYPRIAEELGVSLTTAHRYVTTELERLAKECGEEAAIVRQMELDRLDVALDALADRIEQGDDRAVATMLRIQERRAKLLGLDSPDRQQVEVTGIDPRELLAAKLGRDSG